jgi:hypothetical protein
LAKKKKKLEKEDDTERMCFCVDDLGEKKKIYGADGSVSGRRVDLAIAVVVGVISVIERERNFIRINLTRTR